MSILGFGFDLFRTLGQGSTYRAHVLFSTRESGSVLKFSLADARRLSAAIAVAFRCKFLNFENVCQSKGIAS
jgi:hypothetical protein